MDEGNENKDKIRHGTYNIQCTTVTGCEEFERIATFPRLSINPEVNRRDESLCGVTGSHF